MKKRSWIILIVVAVLVIGGFIAKFRISVRPGYIEDDKKATALEIERFHARVNAEQFDEIYAEAYQGLKNSQNRDKLIQSMRDTRLRTGKFKEVTFSTINVLVGAPIQSRAVYNTSFENGAFTEMFTFVKEDNRYRLAMYTASPGTVRPR